MMRGFIFSLLLLLFASIQAQQTVVSEPQKLNGKTPNSSILGKNSEGIIIYKFGHGNDIIEAYSSNMALRWKKSLNIKQENSSVLKIILYPEKTLVFFLSQTKAYSVIYAQKLNSKFAGDGKFLVVDTINGNRGDISNDLKVVYSQNRAQVVVYYPVTTGNKLSAIQVTELSGDIDVHYRKMIPVPDEAASYQLDGIVPDNKGNLNLLFESRERGKRAKPDHEFLLYNYNAATQLVQPIPFLMDKPVYGSLALEMDNVNDRIDIAGFFSHGDKKEARGYFFESYDLAANKLVAHTYNDFSPELMFQITGKDSTQREKGLLSFHIKQIILRHDGGPLIISESWFTNTENYEVPSFGPTVGPNIRTVKVYQYNDIMVFSLTPTGSLDWSNLLHKKQISEEDEGFYSSYCTVITDDKIHFIYNDEVISKTNVEEYSIDSTGKQERNMLMNAGDRDIMLAPSIGKQISNSEVLIPSFRKNTVRFVKVNF